MNPEHSHTRTNFPHQHHHELLGVKTTPPDSETPESTTWRNTLHLKKVPWIKDHFIKNQVLFPGVGFMMMAIEAITQIRITQLELPKLEDRSDNENSHHRGNRAYSYELNNIQFEEVMVLEENGAGVEVITYLSPQVDQEDTSSEKRPSYEFRITSAVRPNEYDESPSLDFKQNCRGYIRINENQQQSDVTSNLEPRKTRTTQTATSKCTADEIYQRLWDFGLTYGPQFRSIIGDTTWYEDKEEAGREEGREEREEEGRKTIHHSAEAINLQQLEATQNQQYIINPCTLDAALQLNLAVLSISDGDVWDGRVPIGIDLIKFNIRAQSQGLGDGGMVESGAGSRNERYSISGWGYDCEPELGLGRSVGGFRMETDVVVVECSGLRMVKTGGVEK